MIEPAHPSLSLTAQADTLSLSRSSLYYTPAPEGVNSFETRSSDAIPVRTRWSRRWRTSAKPGRRPTRHQGAAAAAETLDPGSSVGSAASVAAAATNVCWCGRGPLIHTASGTAGGRGRPRTKRSGCAERVAVERHTKIRGTANPYDPAWEMYFEERSGVKMDRDLKGHRKLFYLWKEQQGLCPICNQLITSLTKWHKHHLVRRVDGGSDRRDKSCVSSPELSQTGP